MKSLLLNLWLLLVGNPSALRFANGAQLPGFAMAKVRGSKSLTLTRLHSLKVVFPEPAPARLTRAGNIVEFVIGDQIICTGRARRLYEDNQTFTCRDVKEFVAGGLRQILESPDVTIRVSGRPEGPVDVREIDEIEHPINAPISQFILSGDVTVYELKYLTPRERFGAFSQLWELNRGSGKILLHGDFKGKRTFCYFATPETWANILGGQWGTIEWLFAQKNLCKVLKLMLTPTRATFTAGGTARVFVAPANGKDGPMFFGRQFRHDRLDNGNCQVRTNPNLCGLGCKGLGISDHLQWVAECAWYHIDPEKFDVIINEDAIKINSLGCKPGDVIEIPWSAFRVINLNLRRGSGHIGRQIVVMPPKDAQEVLEELGLMDRAQQFVDLCKWDWSSWLRVCSSINDSKMEDNFFHAFLNLQSEAEDWVLPRDMTTLTRAKARLEIAWNDLLVKLPFGNRSVQIGYDFRVDEMEAAWLLSTGQERHFAILGPEYRKELEEYGSVAIATFPMVNDKGLLTVYPIEDENGIIYGPKGMLLLSRAFCAKKYRDGDGDKAAAKGLRKILEFPHVEIEDNSEDPKLVVSSVEDCNIKVLIQAQASWAAAINVGVEDLTCAYIAMSLHRQGIELTPEEQADMGFRREVEGIHLLKHSTGSGKGIDTDPEKIQADLIARFGKGRVPKPSERQKVYFWVDRHDKKKMRYNSSKKAVAAMDKSYSINIPGDIDHHLITRGANVLTAPSIRIMHRLCNLLPAMFQGVTTSHQLLERIKGNPYGKAMALLYINQVGSNMTPVNGHADAIFKKNETSWAWQHALYNSGNSMISGKGYKWDLNTVMVAAEKLDAFYSDITSAINTEYKNSTDWQGRILRKHIQYADVFRSIRFMVDGKQPGYEELYNCPSSIIHKHMWTDASTPGIIYVLPAMISNMEPEERLSFLTLLSIASGVIGWGLTARRNRKSGGVTRLMPFEASVRAEIEYAKFQVLMMKQQGCSDMTIVAAINPVIRKFVNPEWDECKFDILELGKSFDARRKAHDEQISEGWKEEEVVSESSDGAEDDPDLIDDDEIPEA